MRLTALLLLSVGLAAAQLNTLTPKEAAEGWILLFDGESFFGWTPEGKAQWSAVGGSIVGDGGDGGWLRSNSPFADFSFKCDYRVRDGGISGIFLRAARAGEPRETGYELQIWDQHPVFPTGSLANHIAAKRVKWAAGEWHSFEVEAVGDHFTVRIDGRKVLDGYDKKSASGFIGLHYDKGQKVEFHNIKLRPLGTMPLFDGKTLAGWEKVEPPADQPAQVPAVWTVEKGTLHVVHGGGQLETTGTYGNYVLQLDVRANGGDPLRHPDSGIFNRGEARNYWTGYEVQIRNEYKDGDRAQPVDWGTGAVYGRAAARRVVADDNRYFTVTINAAGPRFAVWVDGYPVTDWEDKRPPAASAREGAKTTAGTIGLQAHDPAADLNFRNIRLAYLPK
jgi:hypothetical protein